MQCADNNTADVNDDYLSFELIVTGINLGNNYRISNVAGVNTGMYNQPSFFRTTSMKDPIIELEITDSLDISCKLLISLENKCIEQNRVISNFGINNLSPSSTLTLYPNPARAHLIIEYAANSENVFVEVFDLLGKKVIAQRLTEQRIDISSLNKGLYHLVVREGKMVQTKKFIKD